MSGPSPAASGYRERNATADRALDILGLFADDTLIITGQEVAHRIGVARSTAYRYLQSLVASGFLEEYPRIGYRLGPQVFELARLARKGLGLSEIALPIMTELSAEVGEATLLTRRYGTSVVCVERTSPNSPVRLSYERGHVLPINAGASALALLAWARPADIDEVVAASSLPRHTDITITDADTLLARLEQIRSTGYAISRGELDPDVLGIAAPITGADGQVAAALSIACLSYRVPEERVPGLAAATLAAAERISRRLTLASA